MAGLRRWFQIHLSTAIVLMFVAGALMWANFREMPPETERQHYASEEAYDSAVFDRVFSNLYWGWPCVVYEQYVPYGMVRWKDDPLPYKWNWKGVAINALTALAILGGVAVICESIIRRQDRRKIAS